MSYKSLIYQKVGAVGVVTFNRPAVDNAIDAKLAAELSDVCADMTHDQDVKVVIITGTGERAFAVGADPCQISSTFDDKQGIIQSSIATPVAGLACPVIAAVNGDALGQGLELALACDLRIAVETARFALSHIASGLIPWDGATQRLPRLVGTAKAMEMLLTGQVIDAAEAYRIGLVNRVVKREELMPLVMEIGQTMASKTSSLALKYAKEAILKGLDLTLEQGLCLEADLYCLLQTTEDRTEGIRAFLEKRPPQFKDR
jgi:enoyl-CoA hydratase/carnithine racemase